MRTSYWLFTGLCAAPSVQSFATPGARFPHHLGRTVSSAFPTKNSVSDHQHRLSSFSTSSESRSSPTALVLSSRSLQEFHRENPVQRLARSVTQRLKQTSEVARWRAAAVAFFSTIVLNRATLDVHLAQLWTHLTTSQQSLVARIFRTDSYEWGIAVAAFGVYIHLFGYADRAVRRAAARGENHPWRKYRLQDRFEADKFRRWLLSEGGGAIPVNEADAVVQREMKPVRQSKWHWKAWIFEFWVYVAPLLIWDITAPRRYRRLAAFGAPTTLKILGDIVGGLLLYDILFFCGHFLMHKVPFLYQLVHKKHHHTQEVRACDIVRLSLSEEVYDVLCSIIALNWMGAHPMARTLYNLIIVFLLCELHCGFDFPWAPQNVVPFGLATGSRRHHYHHRFGRHYYQKFFFTVDRLFGFFQKKDGTLKGDSVKKDPYIPSEWKTA